MTTKRQEIKDLLEEIFIDNAEIDNAEICPRYWKRDILKIFDAQAKDYEDFIAILNQKIVNSHNLIEKIEKKVINEDYEDLLLLIHKYKEGK